MRLRSLLLTLATTLSLATAGCASFVPFTAELQSENHLATKDVQNLQFYNSDKITLRRELTQDSRQITGSHKLLVVAGKQIEEVVIEKHTPCVIVGAAAGKLRVSFEEGSFLEFTLRGNSPERIEPVAFTRFAEGPDPFPGNHAAPPPMENERPVFGTGDYFLASEGVSQINYKGQIYDLMDDSGLAHLVISSESLKAEEQKKTVLKGRQL